MHYYSFHIGDYAKQTRYLSLLEDLAYRRLLDLYYTAEAPIPLDVERAARLIGMREQMREVSDVLSDFFVKSEDGYRNSRADREIAAYHAKAERARSANATRWKANKSDPVLKSDLKSDAGRIPTNNQEPITNNQEPDKKHTPGKPAKFAPAAYLAELGIKPGLIDDWLKLRNSHRAPVTQTVLTRIEAEALKAKLPLAEVLALCCARGWRGFQAEWVTKDQGRAPPSGKQAARDAYFAGRQAARDAYWADDNKGDNHAGSERDITGECSVIF